MGTSHALTGRMKAEPDGLATRSCNEMHSACTAASLACSPAMPMESEASQQGSVWWLEEGLSDGKD